VTGVQTCALPISQGLRELGYVEGKNVVIERRLAEGDVTRLDALAAELVRQKPDVIFAPNSISVEAAKKAAGTIPIVFSIAGDPVGSRFVTSLAHPGGNITGTSNIPQELSAKRLQLLKEAVPKIARVAVFDDKTSSYVSRIQVEEAKRAAKVLGMEVLVTRITVRNDFEPVSAQLRKWRADSILIVSAPTNTFNRKLLVEFTAKMRLPAIYADNPYAEAGGLITYGPSTAALYHRAATYVDKILKGAKPGDIPVEQPTQFQLVVNQKTAKSLGINIPGTVLVRADKVIE
jgi:putative ABC transport system substrate-binding protein